MTSELWLSFGEAQGKIFDLVVVEFIEGRRPFILPSYFTHADYCIISDPVLRQILIRAKNGLNLATFKYVGTTDDFNPEPLPGKANRSSVAEAHR